MAKKTEEFNWYKRNPARFIRGVQGMGPELIGAYSVILDLIYADEDSCPNDAAFIAGIMGKCSARKARALIDGLLKIGKLKLNSEGRLFNETAEIELEKRAEAMRSARETGASGGRKAQANRVAPNENNDLFGTPLKRVEKTRVEKKRKKKVTSPGTPSAPGPATRSALPENFPTAEAKSAGVSYWQGKGRPDLAQAVDDQAAQFRDHHSARGNKMLDWPAAWRTWVRNALEMTRPPRGQAEQVLFQQTSVQGWVERLKMFHHGAAEDHLPVGYWGALWGPKPGEPGAKVPQEATAQYLAWLARSKGPGGRSRGQG